ncbi:MAG: DUF2851 family protein [Verrucomicrobiae bacterium]|nr:DUF2851 family protein [Verrucomicrobiae bacterium]
MAVGGLYTSIIERVFPELFCRDAPQKPSEKLLQAIWYHQRIKRATLRTATGEKLRVLHPGFWNCESGPDFKNAVIQFGGEKPVQGDIEIDTRPSDWRSHSHESNPEYKNVILHIVWEPPDLTDKSLHNIPTLYLQEHLESPLAILEDNVGVEPGVDIPVSIEGICARIFKKWNSEQIKTFLEHAALFRLEQKSVQITARAHDTGWEQALLELLFRSLGYKNNIWPFQCIGETCPYILEVKNGFQDVSSAEALLLGVSGLLPDELPRVDKENDNYIRALWDFWWRGRGALSDYILPSSVWKFSGIRPANHPQRRLALAARWLSDKQFFNKLRRWFDNNNKDYESLFLKLLMTTEDNYWNWHYTIKSKKLSSPKPLIGGERATDIAMNVVLPWFLAIARFGRDSDAEKRTINYYLNWSPGQDNSLLKLARKRFFGANDAVHISTAALQQGLIQIAKNFCENSDSLCSTCMLPYEISRTEFDKLLYETGKTA